MSDQPLIIEPPEQVPISELRVGDYVTRVGQIEFRPEKKVTAIERPMVWGGRRAGLWGVGLMDGQAVTANGDGELVMCERLSASEADRRDRMAATMRYRPDGSQSPGFRLII